MSTQETPAAPVNQQPEAATSTSGSAIAGFVLGLLVFVTGGITSIPGVIFSAIGMSRSSKSNGKVTGYGLAVAGLVMSIVGLFIFFLVVIAMLSAMLKGPLINARKQALHVASTNNMKQIGAACRQYEQMKGQAPANLEALFAADLLDLEKSITNPLTEQKDYIFLPYEAKSDGARIILIEAPGTNDSSLGALFYDGHVKMLVIEGKEAQEKFVQALQNNDRDELLKWREKIEDPFYIKGDK